MLEDTDVGRQQQWLRAIQEAPEPPKMKRLTLFVASIRLKAGVMAWVGVGRYLLFVLRYIALFLCLCYILIYTYLRYLSHI